MKVTANMREKCVFDGIISDFLTFIMPIKKKKRKSDPNRLPLFQLSKADSNHHKQNQNLLCYHYTIGQSRVQR